MPVFPHIPNSHKKMEFVLVGFVVKGPMSEVKPELTTKWCATITIIHKMRYSSKLEERCFNFTPPRLNIYQILHTT